MLHRVHIFAGAIATFGSYTEGQLSFGINDLHCNGSEQNISECHYNTMEIYNCPSHDDAGLICQGKGACLDNYLWICFVL